MTIRETDLKFYGWGLVGAPQEDMIVPTASGNGIDVTGYNASDYWDAAGDFRGPDCYGVTPIYRTADGSYFPADAQIYPYLA